MHSIRIKITAITIVAILTSILFVFAASYTILRNETDRNSVRMMNLIEEDTSKSLEKYFESIEHSVEIAANIAVEDLDSVLLVESGAIRTGAETAPQTAEQLAALDAYLSEYCVRIQAFFAGVADYTQGVTTYYYCINPDLAGDERGFFYRRIGKTGFIGQPPIAVRQLKPAEGLQGTWYEAAVCCGRPVWLGPYIDDVLPDTWICSYFVPIYKSGMLIGLMGMDIPCDTLVDQVRDIRVYDTGYVCLLDSEGRVIYHPALPIGSDPAQLGADISDKIVQTKDSGDELIRYTAGGQNRQTSFSTLSNGMKLVIVAPAEEINASWIRLIRTILLISAAIIVFYVLLIFFLMRIITQPLQQLTDASLRLADADYDVDLKYSGRDEIGTLTGSFTRMRDQLRSYIENLNHQLYHDRLTDLPNMRHFFTIAEENRKRMLAEGRQPVMLYFDINGLRHYNRQYGFEKGDQLIRTFAAVLSARFGDRQVCCMSGDQFAAVSDEENAEQEIRQVLREYEAALKGECPPVRVGIYPNRLEAVDVNVACDRAKYAADQARGTIGFSVTWFDGSMLRQGEIYRHIVQNLDRALEEGWVRVYYQPIIRAADGKICDEEALARWIDPDLGFLPPKDFIPALEDARLIYRLDLYVLEQVLAKMKLQAQAGFYLVPQSVNLSRMDFDSCDVVEEIRRRVDAAGIDRSLITVEITESVIGSDFEFMKEQVARFRQLGFPVWMDDFGSGYSSLDVLQQIHFDLLKFDMRFMERFDEGVESRIILTQLMNMAISLGTETVCEGVEQAEQVEFLREIGCTRIQGYFYGKPLPFEEILSRSRKVENGLEFENPAETEYYATIGRINLYDMSALVDSGDETMAHYFNTLPMAVLEVNGSLVRFNRCNHSYREYLERTLGITWDATRNDTEKIDAEKISDRYMASFFRAVVRCSRDGAPIVYEDRVSELTEAHILIRRVAVNPVTGTAALVLAVLAVSREGENDGTDYGQMARALASDYVNLYYVDLDTEKFIEYTPDAEREDLALERHGDDFFAASRRDAASALFREDREDFIRAFTKENIVKALDAQGKFALTYRLMIDGAPTWVELKAVRMPGSRSHIMVGVNNVDARMRQQEALDLMQRERTVFARVGALTRDYICIYTIDPETGRYVEYRASSDYAGLGVPTSGDDFFAQARKEMMRLIDPEDLPRVQAQVTRENILGEIARNGFFSLQYRMLLAGEPRYVRLRAAVTEEQNGPVLIIGVNDIDAQVRQEQEYEQKLYSARSRAHLDALTGIRDRTGYESMSEHLSRQIEEGQNIHYAIVLCRLRDLPEVNETQGRPAGDRLIREACEIICNIFKHSPVFRVAGDQFAVIAQGHDFENIESLLDELSKVSHNRAVSVSSGMAKYDGTESVTSVFARAERLCRESDGPADS